MTGAWVSWPWRPPGRSSSPGTGLEDDRGDWADGGHRSLSLPLAPAGEASSPSSRSSQPHPSRRPAVEPWGRSAAPFEERRLPLSSRPSAGQAGALWARGGGGGEMISAQRSPVPDGLGQFCPRAGFSGDQEAKGGLKVGERPAGGGSMNRTECRKTEPATQTEVSLKTQKCCPTGPLRPCPG